MYICIHVYVYVCMYMCIFFAFLHDAVCHYVCLCVCITFCSCTFSMFSVCRGYFLNYCCSSEVTPYKWKSASGYMERREGGREERFSFLKDEKNRVEGQYDGKKGRVKEVRGRDRGCRGCACLQATCRMSLSNSS